MALSIYKYRIETKNIEINLPLGSQVLSAESQANGVVLYVLLNPEETRSQRFEIKVFGTGEDIHDLEDFVFMGTVKLYGERFMYHVFVRVIESLNSEELSE